MGEAIEADQRSIVDLVAEGTLDAELAALLWLLVEGGTPLIVTGRADVAVRAQLATAVLGTPPRAGLAVMDADVEPPNAGVLAAHLASGTRLGLIVAAMDLRAALATLSRPPCSLAEDALRRLGIVVVLDERQPPKAASVHYLRPTERDGQGHLQRRPPAVLATWDPVEGAFDHFAWGVLSELADRVDRSQADLERRQRARATLLAHLAHLASPSGPVVADRLVAHLAAEPERERAPTRAPAKPTGHGSGPGQPHLH